MKETKDMLVKLEQDINQLSSSVNKLAISIASQTRVLEGHQALYKVQIDTFTKDLAEGKVRMDKQSQRIDELEKVINKAEGAAGFAKSVWGMAWAIGGAVVSLIIMILKGD